MFYRSPSYTLKKKPYSLCSIQLLYTKSSHQLKLYIKLYPKLCTIINNTFTKSLLEYVHINTLEIKFLLSCL